MCIDQRFTYLFFCVCFPNEYFIVQEIFKKKIALDLIQSNEKGKSKLPSTIAFINAIPYFQPICIRLVHLSATPFHFVVFFTKMLFYLLQCLYLSQLLFCCCCFLSCNLLSSLSHSILNTKITNAHCYVV